MARIFHGGRGSGGGGQYIPPRTAEILTPAISKPERGQDGRMGIYDREKLYDEVWNEPALIVAKRYGISGVALGKTCRRLGVPLPPRGYWARIRAGRRVPPQPPLPAYERAAGTQPTRRLSARSDARADKVTDEKGGQGPEVSTDKEPEKSRSPAHMEKTVAGDGRKARKSSPKDTPEYLYCTIDGWQRTYRFGVNRYPPIKGLQEKEGGFDEWDHLQVFATVRYHHKVQKGRKRTGQRVELWVHPTYVPRTEWRDDPEAIGGVWTGQGKMFGSVSVAADAFYSLFPCFASSHFKELVLRIIQMHYRSGKIDEIGFAPQETPMEDLL